MLIIAALGELFILIVSLAIIFIKWHRMEQRYKNKEKKEEEFFRKQSYRDFRNKEKRRNKYMSDAKRCNRCGKYYELIPKNLPGTKTGPKYSVNYYKQLVGHFGAEVESFDLCPDCVQQLTNWAENPDSIILDSNKFDKVTKVSPEEYEKILKEARYFALAGDSIKKEE